MDRRSGELHGRGVYHEVPQLHGGDQHSLHQDDQEQVHRRRCRLRLHQLHQRQRGPDLHAQAEREDHPWHQSSSQVD